MGHTSCSRSVRPDWLRGLYLLLGGMVLFTFSPCAWSDQLALPDDIAAYTAQPYKAAFCFSFAKNYEIPDNLRRRIVGEAQVNIRKAFGKTLVQSSLPQPQEVKVLALLETLGIEHVTAGHLADLGDGLDRVVLIRISKKWNEYAIAFREYLPASRQIMTPVRTGTCRSDLVAWTFATRFWETLCFEAYIASVENLEVKVRFKAQDLAPQKEFFQKDGDVYSIWWTRNGGAKQAQRLEWWFVVMQHTHPELVGSALPAPPGGVYCRMVREIVQGGCQTLRVVSKERPEQGLAEYSVLATHLRPFRERKDFVGVTNSRGEVVVNDPKGRPLHVRVEKKQIILKEFVMLVRPHEGEKVVEVQEFSEKLPGLIQRCRDIREEMIAAYVASEQKLKAAESASDPKSQVKLLREAETLWPSTAQSRRRLEDVQKEAEEVGLDIGSDVASARNQMDEIDRKRPDFSKHIAAVEGAQEAVHLAGSASELEAQAIDIWRKSLDWETASKKLEEAIKLAPDSAEARRKLIDSMLPKNAPHEDARRFVLDQLGGLSQQQLSERAEEIKRYAETLIAEGDVPFLERAVKLLSDHSSKVLEKAAKCTDLCAKAANDEEAKKYAAESEQLIALHEALSILVTKMTGAMGAAAP